MDTLSVQVEPSSSDDIEHPHGELCPIGRISRSTCRLSKGFRGHIAQTGLVVQSLLDRCTMGSVFIRRRESRRGRRTAVFSPGLYSVLPTSPPSLKSRLPPRF